MTEVGKKLQDFSVPLHRIICMIEYSSSPFFHTQLHIALGLGVRHGEATAIVPLTRLRAHFWTFYIKDLVLRLTTMFETGIVLIDYKVIKTLLWLMMSLLPSHRDHEWMVVSEEVNTDFVSLLSAVLESHVSQKIA